MRTAGVYLIVAAVALRGAGFFWGKPAFGAVMGLLAVYAAILVAKTWLIQHTSFSSRYALAVYLLLQAVLTVWLLDASTYEDFFNLLFIPLSLDAVAFFGRRAGYAWIIAFAIAILSVMQFSEQGQLFGLAMGILYSGICFLFGGYAYQVLKAESARAQNQNAFTELQIAHRQLQGYADQVASLAVEHERNRLARDLHDSVTQTVFSMNLASQSARLLLDREAGRASGQLLRLEELAANALREIQSLVSQLKPRSLTDEGLLSSLRRLADERQSRDDLQVTLEIEGEKIFSEAETLGLYAIVNEALTNIIKHSGTREATVRLKLNDKISSLEIEDHGKGFEPQTVSNQRGHLGLAGMSERAQEIGWRLSVESEKDRGTKISVTQSPVGGRE
ncbi:MAG: sensor histidine kinase [Chloroflexi bacterium]|nr:sensor histidine kinase [Chloroflexota bacterium]